MNTKSLVKPRSRTLKGLLAEIAKVGISLINRYGWIEITVRKRDRLEKLVAEYRERSKAKP